MRDKQCRDVFWEGEKITPSVLPSAHQMRSCNQVNFYSNPLRTKGGLEVENASSLLKESADRQPSQLVKLVNYVV